MFSVDLIRATTVKHGGGSVLIRGCMSGKRVDKVTIVDGPIYMCKFILAENIVLFQEV